MKSPTNSSPGQIPVNREKYREFLDFGLVASAGITSIGLHSGYLLRSCVNPALKNSELKSGYQEIAFPDTRLKLAKGNS
jgi:hypothetical protein